MQNLQMSLFFFISVCFFFIAGYLSSKTIFSKLNDNEGNMIHKDIRYKLKQNEIEKKQLFIENKLLKKEIANLKSSGSLKIETSNTPLSKKDNSIEGALKVLFNQLKERYKGFKGIALANKKGKLLTGLSKHEKSLALLGTDFEILSKKIIDLLAFSQIKEMRITNEKVDDKQLVLLFHLVMLSSGPFYLISLFEEITPRFEDMSSIVNEIIIIMESNY